MVNWVWNQKSYHSFIERDSFQHTFLWCGWFHLRWRWTYNLVPRAAESSSNIGTVLRAAFSSRRKCPCKCSSCEAEEEKKNSRGSKASVNIQSQHLSSYANICATLFANIERPALVVIGDSDVKTQTSFHPTFFFFFWQSPCAIIATILLHHNCGLPEDSLILHGILLALIIKGWTIDVDF